MEWHVVDAKSLAVLDRQVGPHELVPAEYEIARRAIYATGDYGYINLLRFSDRALYAGAAALAARTTIVTDVPMVQAGIQPRLQRTFANPVYCGRETIVRPQKSKSQAAWGVQTLAKRYTEGIFAIGADATALAALLDTIATESVRPALIVCTAPDFLNASAIQEQLENSGAPHIHIEGHKGNAAVAVAVLDALIELAWLAYKQDDKKNR